MGNLLAQKAVLYLYHIPFQHNLCQQCDDLSILPSPLNGKIVIPFTLAHQKRQFILKHHHQVILLNDQPLLQNYFNHQFRGVPFITFQQLREKTEQCLELTFDQKYCPIPLILQKFNQTLLKYYLNAFIHRSVQIQYYDRLQNFLRSGCNNHVIVCSNVELQQLSQRIQNQTYTQNNHQKMFILCFCDRDQYIYPKKTQLAMQKSNIQVTLHQNMLEIVEKLKNDRLNISPMTLPVQKVLFFLDQKQKEMQFLLKMAKRIERTVKKAKVAKVLNKQRLVDKIESNQHTVVIFSNDTKEMRTHLEMFEALQDKGLEDRAIFLRRDHEMSSNIMQKIQNRITRPKYRVSQINKKSLVFFGSLQSFKKILIAYPQLKFKKFVDQQTERHDIIQFLRTKSQIVVSTMRICDCMEEWGFIQCKIVLLQLQKQTLKIQKQTFQETKGCQKQIWFESDKELLSYFSQKKQILSLDCNYQQKKLTTIGRILSQTFQKLKQKKTLFYNQLLGSVFLFSCEYYFLDQMSSIILKYFTSKVLGSFEKQCLFPHLKLKLYDQVLILHKTAAIEEQVLQALERDQSKNIFQLSDNLISLAMDYPFFLEQINSIWQLILYQDRPQYLSDCQVILFLMLLSFNKTSFCQYHNQTLQHLTLKIKSGIVAYEEDSLTNFVSKTKNSFVYNMSFLICQEYKPGHATLEEGDIIIKLEGNQLNNFGYSLPIWRRSHQILIAPLTKFQLVFKNHSFNLKISLNSQQKMLQKFNQHFLEEKTSLRLFKQQRKVRNLDAFLQNMCRGKLQSAGIILRNNIKEQEFLNRQLLNAYIVLHQLKRGDTDKAHRKLKHGKYYQILAKVICSCRQGCSVEAAHTEIASEMNNDDKSSLAGTSNHEIEHGGQNMMRSSTFENKPKQKCLRRSSGSYQLRHDQNKNKRRPPAPLRNFEKRRNAETSMIMTKKDVQEEQPKIKIFSPTNKSISCQAQSSSNSDIKKNTASFTSNFFIQQNSKSQSTVKQAFNCSLSRLNSQGSEKSFITDVFHFEDHVNEITEENSPLVKRKSKKKNSRFLQEQLQKQKSSIQSVEQEQPLGSGTATGNFNFLAQSTPKEQFVEEQLEQMEGVMIPEVQQDQQKLSDSQSDKFSSTGTGTDYFKFSLGMNKNGEKIFGRASAKLPRNSIQTKGILHQVKQLQNKLNNIEEESCSYIPSNQNLSKNNILTSSISDKQNEEGGRRSDGQKLFTFFRNEQIKPRFSGTLAGKIPSSSLMISQESSCAKIDDKLKTQNKNQLFMIFGDQEKSQLESQESSILSIDFEQAQGLNTSKNI